MFWKLWGKKYNKSNKKVAFLFLINLSIKNKSGTTRKQSSKKSNMYSRGLLLVNHRDYEESRSHTQTHAKTSQNSQGNKIVFAGRASKYFHQWEKHNEYEWN